MKRLFIICTAVFVSSIGIAQQPKKDVKVKKSDLKFEVYTKDVKSLSGKTTVPNKRIPIKKESTVTEEKVTVIKKK